jgi:hypothetical protein
VREYIRPIMGKCSQGEAVTAFRDLFDETGGLPESRDVINRVGAKTERDPLQGEDVYLHSVAGFCYGPGMLGITVRAERINGISTKRLLDCQTFCGCYRCHRRPEAPIQEPEPIDLPGPVDPYVEEFMGKIAERKKMP